MDIHRRRVLSLAAAVAAAGLGARQARSESYPVRPVRVIVGFPAGSGADLLTRIVCDWLQLRLGQAFVVDNRPGAATNLATEAVVRAPADGYTLLATTTSNLLNGSLFDDLKYDFIRDIAPVASLSTQPLVLDVGADAEFRTLPQLLAHAAAFPGKLSVGHTGNGTIAHLALEALKLQAGVDMLAVPYRGSAALLPDLLGGRIHAAVDNMTASIEQIRSGRLHPLAVTTAVRSDALPNVPTVGESLLGYEAYTIAGIGAPRGTPKEIVDKLNAEINAGLRDAKLRARLADLGSNVLDGTAADFAQLIARETDKWRKVIKTTGIRIN